MGSAVTPLFKSVIFLNEVCWQTQRKITPPHPPLIPRGFVGNVRDDVPVHQPWLPTVPWGHCRAQVKECGSLGNLYAGGHWQMFYVDFNSIWDFEKSGEGGWCCTSNRFLWEMFWGGSLLAGDGSVLQNRREECAVAMLQSIYIIDSFHLPLQCFLKC